MIIIISLMSARTGGARSNWNASECRESRADDATRTLLGGQCGWTFVWALTDVDVAGAELDQPRDRLLLVIDGRALQIEMETVLPRRLPLRDRQEVDPESRVIRRHETNFILGLVVYLPAQRGGPEARETERIVRIEAESVDPRSRPALHHPTCRVMPAHGASSRSDRNARTYMLCATPITGATPSGDIFTTTVF